MPVALLRDELELAEKATVSVYRLLGPSSDVLLLQK